MLTWTGGGPARPVAPVCGLCVQTAEKNFGEGFMEQIFQAADEEELRGVDMIAQLEGIDPERIRARLGFFPIVGDDILPGLGTFEAYPCQLKDGTVFSLLRAHMEKPSPLMVCAHGMDVLYVVLEALQIDYSAVSWRADVASGGTLQWEVIRQDDNGHRSVMAFFAEQNDADRFCERWTSRLAHHKQICFVRKSDPRV